MTEHECVVCPVLRPDVDPRIYDRAHVCDGCRAHLGDLLDEVAELYGDVELERAATGGAKVSGSRTPPLPLDLHALDITMPPGPAGVVHDPYGDQVGQPSIAATLDSWARDWQTYAWALLPAPTVPLLVGWLADRVGWACDRHPAIDAFATELADQVARLRPRPERPERKVGVPCRQCEHVTLYRRPRSSRIECGSCPAIMTIEEYARWTQLIAMPAHQPWVRQMVTEQRGDASRERSQ